MTSFNAVFLQCRKKKKKAATIKRSGISNLLNWRMVDSHLV